MPKRARAFVSTRSAKKRGRTGLTRVTRTTVTRAAAPQGLKRMVRPGLASMGFLTIERKFYDTKLDVTALTAPTDSSGGEYDPSTTSMMTTPDQGDGPSQRDGKEIAMLYLQINGFVSTNALEAIANPPSGLNIFVACVLDTQTNAAQMNSEDCFKNTSGQALLAANPQKNLLFGKRFRILKERIFNMDTKAISHIAADEFANAGQRKAFKWFIPLNGLKVRFSAGTTASIANVIDNSVHMIAYASGTTQVPSISYNARLRFVG